MDLVYLGLFQTILDWVLDKIFTPIFSFLASLLNTVFSWIFETVIGPLLEAVLIPIMKWVIEMIFDIFAELFYQLFAAVLKIIDYMQIAFDVLIGMRNVSYTDAANVITEQPLLDTMILHPTVRRAFFIIAALALGIALLLTIYATLKSIFDFDFDNKRPVSKVLTSFMKTGINFLMIPLLVLVMVKLSGIILSGIDTALTRGNMTIGNTIFLVSSLNAAIDDQYNLNAEEHVTNIGLEDTLRVEYFNGTKSYANVETVRGDFDFSEFDYLVGFASSIFLMIILAVCLITFVQRIFEMLTLYLVSPLFVSTMPLDDGEKFDKWREMFIAKCFMGFGAAIGMRLYLIICPLIMGGSISFIGDGEYISTEMDYVIKLLFLIGGAWAIFKSGPMITSLLSFQAASSEQMTAGMVGGAVGSMAMRMRNGIRSGISSMSSSLSARAENSRKEKEDSTNEFKARRDRLEGSSGIKGLSKKDKDLVDKAMKKEEKLNAAKKRAAEAGYGNKPEGAKRPPIPKKPLPPTPKKKPPVPNKPLPPTPKKKPPVPNKPLPPIPGKKPPVPNKPLPPIPGKKPPVPNKPLPPIPGKKPPVPSSRPSSSALNQKLPVPSRPTTPIPIKKPPQTLKDTPKLNAGQITKLPLGFGIDRDAAGKKHLSMRKGPVSVSFSEKGKTTSVLGFKFKSDTQGRLQSFSLPGSHIKSKRGDDGNMHVTKLNYGIASWSASKSGEKLRFQDMSVIGLKRSEGSDGQMHTTSLGMIGLNREEQANGEFAKTQLLGMSFAHKVSADGTRTLGCVKIGNMIFGGDASKNKDEEKKG